MIKLTELYWLAGIFEGEGYFGLEKGRRLNTAVMMTDKDVVDRVHDILGFGIRGERSLPSGKTAYRWSSNAQPYVAGLMMTLFPLMGERRQEKIIRCLAVWKTVPLKKAMWTHCKSGHALEGGNLRVVQEGKYSKRRCRKCVVLRQKKYLLKKRETLETAL